MSTTQPGFDLIWAWREEMGDVYTGEWAPADDPHAPMEAVEYVRADVHAAQIADLTSQLAEAREVKPLEWDDLGYEWSWWADTAFGRGTYQIRCEGGIGYLVDFDGVTIGDPHDILEAAKAAAQADYTARILSALKGMP